MCDNWQLKNVEVMQSRSHGENSSIPEAWLQVYDRHVFKDIQSIGAVFVIVNVMMIYECNVDQHRVLRSLNETVQVISPVKQKHLLTDFYISVERQVYQFLLWLMKLEQKYDVPCCQNGEWTEWIIVLYYPQISAYGNNLRFKNKQTNTNHFVEMIIDKNSKLCMALHFASMKLSYARWCIIFD